MEPMTKIKLTDDALSVHFKKNVAFNPSAFFNRNHNYKISEIYPDDDILMIELNDYEIDIYIENLSRVYSSIIKRGSNISFINGQDGVYACFTSKPVKVTTAGYTQLPSFSQI